jgi:restriction endonuclease S subunit
MPEVNFINTPLEELFVNKRGNSKYTKKYCNARKGPYELLTGSTKSSFAKVDFCDYDTPNLTYTTDGAYAGTVNVLTGKYNVGGHRALLIPKDDQIDLYYCEHILQPIFMSFTKDGSVPSLTWNIIKKIVVPVPVREDGMFDIEKQKEISSNLQRVEERKIKLLNDKQKLENTITEANFTEGYNFKEVNITKLFTPKTGGMKYTKSYCNSNRGDYPIYSGNTRTEFAHINSHDYDGKYITWAIDGLAGYIMVLEGKFSITNHRGILIPVDNNNLDLDYMKFILEPIFRKNIKGRMGHDGQNEYTSLKQNAVNKIKQKIRIPVKEDGTFDLEAQKEIAKKYNQIENVKKAICNKIDELTSINLNLS